MNADSIFQIGRDHTVCEDYALSGTMKDVNADIAYAIVCDGCSASNDVDTGARLLALSARENIFWSHLRENCKEFGNRTIFNASEILHRFPSVSKTCLDATLLVAYVQDKKLTLFGFGDGVLVHKSKTGTKFFHVGLSSGAPDYLSYHLDNNRMIAYNALMDNRKTVATSFDGITDYKPFIPINYSATLEEGDVVAVISDGINSFRMADNTPIEWEGLLEEFIGFKNYAGVFVNRRMAAFQRKCLKEGWHHHDDISIAAIVV
jgi:serine/threonine protein phosphatase PrpC